MSENTTANLVPHQLHQQSEPIEGHRDSCNVHSAPRTVPQSNTPASHLIPATHVPGSPKTSTSGPRDQSQTPCHNITVQQSPDTQTGGININRPKEHITMTEELRAELEREKAATMALQQEAAQAELVNILEKEKQEQEAWKTALEKLKQAREEQNKRHAERLAGLRAVTTVPTEEVNPQLDWIKKKLAALHGTTPEPEELIKKVEEVNKTKSALEKILEQQKQLVQQATSLTQGTDLVTPEIQGLLDTIQPPPNPNLGIQDNLEPSSQDRMMEQLKAALTSKKQTSTGDWQKDALRQFLIASNRTGAAGGATTLKPDLLKRITSEQDEFSMADWLATLNKEEAGEWVCDDSDECKHKKVRSGMLDRATANIVHKEVWPQKNLLEDWADEEMDFKHLQFEHHIAGEVRTIETCTEPAQILGRLRLLRRMAYAKLRGYEWPIIRKMYAAIVRSIEAKEYSWSDNFDRFETILYRRPATQHRQTTNRGDREQQKKWFCRDWNKSEGCSKQAPHKAWFGSGQNAVSRTVLHMCAACYMRDRAVRDHPENHEGCPNRTA